MVGHYVVHLLSRFPTLPQDLLRVVEAVQELLLKERQEKLQLEMRLREEICNEMMEHLQQREQWSSDYVDAQKDMLEELYEDKLKNLKESLTDYYLDQIETRDEKIKELEATLEESKRQQNPKRGSPPKQRTPCAGPSGRPRATSRSCNK
ncbi:hypothetical protein JRQ81_002779 [Phrynocephalus forsythii]|uniref:Uncharacterized protein n=1 Tax=Phrynocephalus forsythii TaxID=171643 RepID=A0A9Q0XLV1_9SAUR|nr:hypothetical protein JRQ81_002779 [Phrynocephalus forsythii]